MPREGHGPPIGRHDGPRPAALLGDELAHGSALHVDRVEIRFAIAIVRVRFAQSIEDDRASVRGPVVVGRAEAAKLAGREVTLRVLARRPTLRRHEEDLRRDLLDEAGPITTVMQPLYVARSLRALRVFG